MKYLFKQIRISLVATVSLGLILCGLYPLTVWVLSRGLLPHNANGSLIVRKGTVIGSGLLCQGFTSPKYFHPRPSAAGQGYDATLSGGSNLGPLSKKLMETVKHRAQVYRTENNLSPEAPVPADAVTASGSGLDPHISVANAMLQAERVAKARELTMDAVRKKVQAHIEGRTFGILGEPRVNVVMLNLDLDGKR